MELQRIDLGFTKRQTCRLMICQFNAAEYDWEVIDGLSFIIANHKIQAAITESLTIAKKNSVELVIFPELSIPIKYLDQIQKWSEELSSIVIAGSHYFKKDTGYVSRSPIIVNGSVHFTEKIMPSPLEKSPIKGEGLNIGSKVLKMTNSAYGNFAVLICSDYLSEDVKDAIGLEDLDILCVIAFQRQSELYYRRLATDCENSNAGIYIAYANFIDEKHGDGKSALFGIVDKMFSAKFEQKGFTDLNPETKLFQFKDTDKYAILDVNLFQKRPYINKNISTEPNVYFVSKSLVGHNELSKFSKKIAHDDERYIRIDDYYVPPKEYNEIKDVLEHKNLVFIVGDPGIGKTYTAVKLLKEYYDKGYEPIWFSGLDREERATQSKTLLAFIPTDKQIVYFEDPFGKITFEKREALYQVFNPLMDALKQYDTKVIVTSRKDVFEKFSQESLLNEDVIKLKRELNVRKPSYDSVGLQTIFDKLAASACLWYPNKEFQDIIYKAIQEGELTTPLSIRDLVFSIRNLDNPKLVKHSIENRGDEIVNVFALEIVNASPATKLLLYLVFFLGRNGHSIMNRYFDLLLDKLKEVVPGDTKPVFNVELRSQMGFRIEQYGSVKTFYKFSHPVYEEALAALAESDYVSKYIVQSLLVAIAAEDSTEAYRKMNSFVIKYPTLCLSLFTHLLSNRHVPSDSGLKLLLCQKLISISYALKDNRFFELASSVYPLKNLVQEINGADKSNYQLAHQLNLASRYKNLSPSGFDFKILEKIDWQNIFGRKQITGYKYLSYFLSNCIQINPKAKNIFLKHFPLALLRRAYLVGDTNERKALKNLLGESKVHTEFLKLDALIDSSRGSEKNRKASSIRKILFSDYKYYGELEIDVGAFGALRKFYNNLLPAGIVRVNGNFDAGSIVGIVCNKKLVAVGMAEYSSAELNLLKGHSSQDFPHLLSTMHTISAIQNRYIIHLFSKRNQGDLPKWKNRTFRN